MQKLRWGLIGGGEGSQIGPIHRMAAALDGQFELTAGALDHRPDASRAFGQKIGLPAERTYGDWRTMLATESKREDRLDLVTIATPNGTHYDITKAFLEAGFHVLCEKPMTLTVAQSQDITQILQKKPALIYAVNFGYSGYALVREMRAMIQRGDLGEIRVVKTEFSHGHHANANAADNDRIRWRYDPKQMGYSAQFADCGIHALHLACFVTGQQVTKLSADVTSCVAGRQLEDDAMVNFRMSQGTVGRLWTSSIAVGRQHGLAIEIFGEKGGLSWCQEHPNQLRWMPVGGRAQLIERGESGLSAEASRASRVTIGHAEGFPEAIANIYWDLAQDIAAHKLKQPCNTDKSLYPCAWQGLHSMAAIDAVIESGQAGGQWVDISYAQAAPLRA